MQVVFKFCNTFLNSNSIYHTKEQCTYRYFLGREGNIMRNRGCGCGCGCGFGGDNCIWIIIVILIVLCCCGGNGNCGGCAN